jgi:UDPglucose 6-dehydrogenase
LVRRGASVRVCDPEALDAARRELASLGDAVTFCADEYEAANGAQCCAIVTPWNQYRNLDLRRLKSLLASPFFFDLRNIYKRADAEAAGLVYFGVGT